MFKLKSSNIKDFPFQEYAEAEDLESLASQHYLTSHNSWMLPQISAHYGNWTLVYSDGKVDPKATARLNAGSNKWELGLWKVVTKLRRGLLVKSQVTDVTYSALSPIILAAVKKFQGVPFSAWDIQPGCPLVDEPLLEAMLWRDPDLFDESGSCTLGSDKLLEIRTIGLTTKSGAKAGAVAKPTSSWCLKGIRGTELGHAPKLAVTMLSQIWVAHPSLRNQYLILDPYNWDIMPEPLVNTKLFEEEVTKPADLKSGKLATVEGLPW